MMMRIEAVRIFRIWDYLFGTVWMVLLVVLGAINNVQVWDFTVNFIPRSWLEPVCMLPPIIIISMIRGQTKQKIMTAIQIVAVVVIFLIFCLIILSISFRIMEYCADVARSLNITVVKWS
jgi:hypothetical protein